MAEHIRLAQALPPRLLNFFKRYPPPLPAAAPTIQHIQIAENTSSSDPNTPSTTTLSASSTPPATPFRNPFLPHKYPGAQSWTPPRISLRRQADLLKLAHAHHVLSLMPPSAKSPAVRAQKRAENGLRVQGTGQGRRVKGKLWERTMKERLEKRRRAMEGMPEMILQWKQKGHGRGWKKWPK